MEEAPAPTVRPDPYAVSLAKGDHPATFGIILTTLWRTAPSDLSSQLESLREEVLRATGDDCLYFYPFSALHCTVASLLKFTSGLGKHLAKADEKEQTAYIDKWKALVDKVYSHKDFPRKPAKVTFQRPELPGTTAIILIENQGKEVFQIRDLLKQECKEPPDKYHLQINIPEITHFPNIVHSSVARFKSPPKDEKKFREAFSTAAAKWKPVTCELSEIYLTVETVPYMHMDKSSAVKKTYKLDEKSTKSD